MSDKIVRSEFTNLFRHRDDLSIAPMTAGESLSDADEARRHIDETERCVRSLQYDITEVRKVYEDGRSESVEVNLRAGPPMPNNDHDRIERACA